MPSSPPILMLISAVGVASICSDSFVRVPRSGVAFDSFFGVCNKRNSVCEVVSGCTKSINEDDVAVVAVVTLKKNCVLASVRASTSMLHSKSSPYICRSPDPYTFP